MKVGEKYVGRSKKTVYEIVKVGERTVTLRSDYTSRQKYESPNVTTIPKRMFLELFSRAEDI